MSGISIAEALELGLIRGARLVAGARGLGGIIRHVSYSDAPDSASFMRGNELVLSTGYGVRENPEALIEFIENHRRNGTVALAIKPKRFLGQIPKQVLEYADRVGHPVLDIPAEVPWVDIINPLLTEILNQQAANLQRVMMVHQELAQIILGGTGLTGMARRLATMVGHPVGVFDHLGQLVAMGLPDHLPELPSALREMIRSQGPVDARGVLEHNDSLPCRTYPVMVDRVKYGYLCAYPFERPFRETDQLYFEQAAVLVALEMLKERAIAEVEQRHRWQFLEHVLSGWFTSSESLVSRARELGYDLSQNYSVAVLNTPSDTGEQWPERSRRARQALFEAVQMRLRAYRALCVDRGTELVVLLPLEHRDSHEYKFYTVKLLTDVLAQLPPLQEQHHTRIYAGIGQYYPDPVDLHQSYREARETVRVLCSVAGDKQVAHLDNLGVYRLLYPLGQEASSHLIGYYQHLLGPLLDSRDGGLGLLETLEVYLRLQSVREAGRILHIHPNTVKYRLRKIEELTGVDLSDFEIRVGLYVALAAKRVIGQSG